MNPNDFYDEKDPDDFDNEALNATDPHTANYWRLARSGQEHVNHDDPLPDPGDPDHHESYYGYRWLVDDRDIVHASFQIATLLFGPDNGSPNRDDIECQIQKVIKTSFDWTQDAMVTPEPEPGREPGTGPEPRPGDREAPGAPARG